MRIGELSKEAGVNIETIRYYERIGLIIKPEKPLNGYRDYTEELIITVRFIKNAQRLGFSLSEIKELLSLRVDPNEDCGKVKTKSILKIEEIDKKISALNSMKESLTKITEMCNGVGTTSKCNILNALNKEDLI